MIHDVMQNQVRGRVAALLPLDSNLCGTEHMFRSGNTDRVEAMLHLWAQRALVESTRRLLSG